MELRQYFEVLKRHKWFLVRAVAIGLLVVGIVSALRPATYSASSRILLRPDDPAEQVNREQAPRAYRDPNRYVEAHKDIIRSQAVLHEAAQSIPNITSKKIEEAIAVESGDQSDVITVSATDTNATRARNIANAVARSYIENRRQYAVAGLSRAVDEIDSKLGALQATIAEIDSRIETGSEGSPDRPLPAMPDLSSGSLVLGTTPEALRTARDAAAVQYESLFQRQQELLVDISLKRGEAELINQAETPASPVSPKPIRDAVLGGIVGLLLGVGVSLLREQMDDRFRSVHDVNTVLGVPVLAELPRDDDSMAEVNQVAVVSRPSSSISEAVRSLRTSIQYFDLDRPLKVIVVTSALPGEGKSLVSANLAAVYAQAGKRTVLLSADLRRVGVTRYFRSTSTSVGLTGLITQMNENGKGGNGKSGDPSPASASSIPDAQVRADNTGTSLARTALLPTGVANLAFLPPGPVPPNPAELLNSQRMTQLLGDLERAADVVIVDTPPLLPVTDAAVVAARADGVVLVVALGETRRAAGLRAKAVIEGTGARLLGVVVNKGPTTGSDYYYGRSEAADVEGVAKRHNMLRRATQSAPRSTSSR